MQAVLLKVQEHQAARKQQAQDRSPTMGGGEQPRLVEQHELVGFRTEQRHAGLPEQIGAVDRTVLGGRLLHLSLGIGQHGKRVADERPALVAGNVAQRLGFRRRYCHGRGHMLHRHGNCSGAWGAGRERPNKIALCRAGAKICCGENLGAVGRIPGGFGRARLGKQRAGRRIMPEPIRGFLAALALAALASAAHAQTRPAVTSLGPYYQKTAIFIGNSFFYYNNGMPAHVTLLEKAADSDHKTDYRATMMAIGGAGLNRHDVESYFRRNATGSFSSYANNDVLFGKRARLFDAAVMMDCSQCPIHPKLKSMFTAYAKRDADI